MDGETTVRTGEAYVSGALAALDDGARMRLFYELLAEVVESVGLRAYLPQRVTDPVVAAQLEPRALYDIDRAHVTSARVVVAYAGIPSFGVGIEVELAREHAVPVVLVVERERSVSRLLLGNPAVVDVVRFADLDGLRRGLAAALGRIAAAAPGSALPVVSDDVVVQRFLASLEQARHLPDGEIAALLRSRSGTPSRPVASSAPDCATWSAVTRSAAPTSACSCCATYSSARSPIQHARSASIPARRESDSRMRARTWGSRRTRRARTSHNGS